MSIFRFESKIRIFLYKIKIKIKRLISNISVFLCIYMIVKITSDATANIADRICDGE
jgi:hypothetical protein